MDTCKFIGPGAACVIGACSGWGGGGAGRGARRPANSSAFEIVGWGVAVRSAAGMDDKVGGKGAVIVCPHCGQGPVTPASWAETVMLR